MKPVHPLVAVLLTAAAMIVPATAQGVTLTHHLVLPHGLTRAAEDHVVASWHVSLDSDHDGIWNGPDGCAHEAGPRSAGGCKPEPVVTSPEEAAPAPALSTVASSATGSSNAAVDPSCESGGDPTVYDPSGNYWGKYQFDESTWNAYAPSGSWGSATEAEQDAAAAAVPYDAWPNC